MVSSAVSQIILHPYYAGAGLSGDIALMRLKKPVSFSRSISPICLPSASGPEPFPVGMKCWITGWGHAFPKAPLIARTLREVEVPILDGDECDQMLHNNTSDTTNSTSVHDDMICAGYQEGQKDSCQGDSGGPLACNQNNTWFLAGVVSFGLGCGEPNQPGVYTRVTSYMDWIQRTMAENNGTHLSRASGVTFLLLHLLLGLTNMLW
ncbi:serine protease 30-like [Hemicordylus capensis]|uniref:serine protease 30-like n=1 Tax=Hemicordylus capensis TaxID=884348 RepID=UPI0023035A84|nr:serine protease 30-like [Hemicordylus capensis]